MQTRALLFLLSLAAASSVALGQTSNADYLPLDVGNRWTYEYHAREMDYLGESFWGDSACAIYTIVSRDSTTDSISWRFQESLDGIKWRGTFGTAGHSYSEYPFSDTTYFELVESAFGAHRLQRNEETDWAWTSVFCLVPDFSDSSRYFRFLPHTFPDTFTVTATYSMDMPYESLTVAFKRSIGIVDVKFHQFGVTGGEEWTHHELKEASLTATSTLQDHSSPFDFTLENNFPNPFNPTTLITFSVGVRQKITIEIVDLLGRSVATLFDGVASPGTHVISWNASAYASGSYFCIARGASITRTLKLVFVK